MRLTNTSRVAISHLSITATVKGTNTGGLAISMTPLGPGRSEEFNIVVRDAGRLKTGQRVPVEFVVTTPIRDVGDLRDLGPTMTATFPSVFTVR